MTLFWKAIYLISRWSGEPKTWQRGACGVWPTALPVLGACIWICKQTLGCLTLVSGTPGSLGNWGTLPDPLGSVNSSDPWEKKCWSQKLKKLSQDTLSDLVHAALFWDPGCNRQSGLGTLSSFLSEWMKQQKSSMYTADSSNRGGDSFEQLLNKGLPFHQEAGPPQGHERKTDLQLPN